MFEASQQTKELLRKGALMAEVGDRRDKKIRDEIAANHLYGMTSQDLDNAVIAKNVLREDIEEGLRFYGLDKPQSDRLLAHARQDAAHAVINTSSILDVMTRITDLQRRITRFQKIIMALLILLIFMVGDLKH